MRLFDVLKRNSKRRRKSRSIEYIYYRENEYFTIINKTLFKNVYHIKLNFF